MCKGPTLKSAAAASGGGSNNAQMMWSIMEHIIKAMVYTIVVAIAVKSAINGGTSFPLSVAMKTVFAFFVFWKGVKGEIEFIIKRVQRKMPPGYLGFPILREINFFVGIATGKFMTTLQESRAKYGTMFAQNFFGQATIICGGQDDLNWLFQNDRKALTDVAWPPNIVKLLGPGAVANQTGKYHRVLRRLLEPYFAPIFVKNYFAAMDETTLDELEAWSSLGEFQSSEVFKMYALRLFYVSSFGTIDDDVISTLHDDFRLWIGGFMSLTAKEIPGTAFAEAMKARDRILDTVDMLISKFEKENPEDSVRSQTTIIGRLIYGKDDNDNRMMTRDEMKDNILNLIFAGHDTTYASISTLLYHLSESPDAMKALTEEVSSLKEPFNSDVLKKLPVLNACIYESWRMDPPVTGGFRKALKDLQHKGYTFEPGTAFNYSILLTTTDENQYKTNDKFRMERFLPKDHALYSPDIDSGIDPAQGRASYPIFGGGTHICLGKAFAQLEMRVLAARMMQQYQVEVRNPKKEYFPVNGWSMEFKLTKRKDE